MGDLYVTAQIDVLKHFYENVLTESFNKYTRYYNVEPSDDFNEALVWRGLKIHNVKAWTDLKK